MLRFERKGFTSGTIVIRESVMEQDEKNGAQLMTYTYRLTPAHKGKQFAFKDEAKILAKYPHMFTKVEA